MITSKLIIDRLVAPSQVQQALERAGATDCEWHEGGPASEGKIHIAHYLHFTFLGERRQLQYFFSVVSEPDKKDDGLSLSINWWGHDQEIMAALKGAFGGRWYRDENLTPLEARGGMDDILKTDDIETHLMRTIFEMLLLTAKRMKYDVAFFQLYDGNKLDPAVKELI